MPQWKYLSKCSVCYVLRNVTFIRKSFTSNLKFPNKNFLSYILKKTMKQEKSENDIRFSRTKWSRICNIKIFLNVLHTIDYFNLSILFLDLMKFVLNFKIKNICKGDTISRGYQCGPFLNLVWDSWKEYTMLNFMSIFLRFSVY